MSLNFHLLLLFHLLQPTTPLLTCIRTQLSAYYLSSAILPAVVLNPLTGLLNHLLHKLAALGPLTKAVDS